MSDVKELLERVEAATGPDRKLEADVCRFLAGGSADHWYDFFGTWTSDGKTPTITASIDAALALKDRKLPGCACALGDMAFTAHPRGPWATIWTPEGEPKWNAEAATPPLAILAALLKAVLGNSTP